MSLCLEQIKRIGYSGCFQIRAHNRAVLGNVRRAGIAELKIALKVPQRYNKIIMSAHQEFLQEFEQFARDAPTADALMAHLAQQLHEAWRATTG